MMMFGQRVPAWDSSYYPLMITRNVPYREFLKAKWSLIIISILIAMVLSTAYLYFGTEIYLTVLAGGLYNLGVNSFLTLLAGAYNKQPIDLNSAAKGFGSTKESFNIKLILISLPQFAVPMIVFSVIKWLVNIEAAVGALALLGVMGFLLRNRIFDWIAKAYKTEKYSTLSSFKKIE